MRRNCMIALRRFTGKSWLTLVATSQNTVGSVSMTEKVWVRHHSKEAKVIPLVCDKGVLPRTLLRSRITFTSSMPRLRMAHARRSVFHSAPPRAIVSRAASGPHHPISASPACEAGSPYVQTSRRASAVSASPGINKPRWK